MRPDVARLDVSPDQIDGSFVPVPRTSVTAVVLEGETVVLEEGAPDGFYLDRLATLVWDMFDGSASLDELAEDFAEAFNADLGVVRDDIVSLTRSIARAGLLAGVAPSPRPKRSGAWDTGVGIGAPIPPFTLPDVNGTEVAITDLAGQSVLLVTWSPRCEFCAQIASELMDLQPDLRARAIGLVLITMGDAHENGQLLGTSAPPTVLFSGEDETAVFAGVGTPAAYLMDEEGCATSELTVGADCVANLARSAAGR